MAAKGHDRHSHGDGHVHVPVPVGAHDARLFSVAFALILGFMAVEVVVGLLFGSLALVADAGHMLVDAGAIGAALWVFRLSRLPAAGRWTYGFKRAEVLSALGNGITLLVVAALVTYAAVRRLIHPVDVNGTAMVTVASAGVVVNLAGTLLIRGADRRSLNVEGAFQHLLTDLYAFVGTGIAGAVVLGTGFRRADPIVSLVVVLLMVRAAATLLHRSGEVLLEAAPGHVDLADLVSHLKDAPHVLGLHDLHVWTVSSELPALSAHVVVDDECFTDGHAPQILDELQRCLVGHFDVEHSTFQLEPASHAEHEFGHHP